MINEFVATSTNTTYPMDRSRLPSSEYKIHTQILFVDSVKTFNLLVRNIRNTTFEKSGLYQKYFVLLPNSTSCMETVIGEILSSCLNLLITDVNILIEDHQGNVNVYTYFPCTPRSCRNSTPVFYNRFKNDKFLFKEMVFPNKNKNLWKCPLKAIVWHNEPLVNVRKNRIDGIEISFLNILAGLMNFSVELVMSPDGRGDVLKDGTTLGAFRMIDDGQADLMFGGNICSQERSTFLASTKEYLVTKLDFVLKPTRIYSAFEILFIPFDVSTWVSIVLIIVTKWTWTFVMKKYIGRKAATFSKGQALRFQIVSWLFGTFILRCLYEGSMFKFFYDRPYRKPPRNIEELLTEGYFIVTRDGNDFFFQTLELRFGHLNDSFLFEEHWSGVVDKFHNSSYEKLALLAFTDFVPYDEVTLGHGQRHKKYQTTEFPAININMCGNLQKFSCLTEEINRRINQLTTAGLLEKIFKVNRGQSVWSRNSSANLLSLNQLLGIFQCLVISCSTSILVFLLETFSKHNKFLRKLLNILH
ncbi:uncharacterized protein LOC129953798 [Eupeodes corollae]|uniref:uncharacterized protein LOC129953798 n=1 Tax=Eupeodes corollae TaxID=290404 RepID=UPI0024921B23|nr:uncharacterized protein LOC129953798 [Eupeodes corollae]